MGKRSVVCQSIAYEQSTKPGNVLIYLCHLTGQNFPNSWITSEICSSIEHFDVKELKRVGALQEISYCYAKIILMRALTLFMQPFHNRRVTLFTPDQRLTMDTIWIKPQAFPYSVRGEVSFDTLERVKYMSETGWTRRKHLLRSS